MLPPHMLKQMGGPAALQARPLLPPPHARLCCAAWELRASPKVAPPPPCQLLPPRVPPPPPAAEPHQADGGQVLSRGWGAAAAPRLACRDGRACALLPRPRCQGSVTPRAAPPLHDCPHLLPGSNNKHTDIYSVKTRPPPTAAVAGEELRPRSTPQRWRGAGSCGAQLLPAAARRPTRRLWPAFQRASAGRRRQDTGG